MDNKIIKTEDNLKMLCFSLSQSSLNIVSASAVIILSNTCSEYRVLNLEYTFTQLFKFQFMVSFCGFFLHTVSKANGILQLRLLDTLKGVSHSRDVVRPVAIKL